MKRIGLLGGTFNPIHNGHLVLAQNAYEACDLDEVWLIPSGISYMKSEQDIPEGKLRYEMACLAAKDYDFIKVSDLEIKREGNSYTCDTLEELHRQYPDDAFYFIIGDDSLFAMETWSRPERIFALASMIVALRDYSPEQIKDKVNDLEKNYQARIVLMEAPPFMVSSTQLRAALLQQEDVSAFLPKAVIKYIEKHKLYQTAYPKPKEIRKKLRSVQSNSRYEHTLGVAYTAQMLACIHGANPNDALLAGLLHDCAKCIPEEELLNICKKNHLEVSAVEERNPFLLHAKVGSYLAKEEYHIKNEDILNAITYHTTGRPKMSPLEKIIFIADFIEPGRTSAPNLLAIRQMAYQDLDQAIVMVLESTLRYLESKGQEIDDMTRITYRYYDVSVK